MKPQRQVRFDLLSFKPLRSLMLWSGFPLVLQSVAAVFVLALIFIGLDVGSGAQPAELTTLRKTNLTTLVVWGMWWPAMIAAALLLGRVWCTVCPMELVSRSADELARHIGWPRARLGKFLRAGWFSVIGYLVLQLLVAGVSLHRVPHYTALLLIALLAAALFAGLLFREPRSFCRAFCPAGALLSVYGRYTPVQLEIGNASICAACPTRDCVRTENRHRFDKRSCPSLLRPFNRTSSDPCVLCLQCAKICPHANVGFGIVSPAAPIRRKGLLRPFEAAFVMIALGFVAHETIGEVDRLEQSFHLFPERLHSLWPVMPFGWFEALWFLLLFPFVAWSLTAGLAYAAGHRGGIRSLLLAAATGAAPMVAIAHLAKALAKIDAWAGYLPLAFHDPRGLATLRQISDHSLAAPGRLVGFTVVGYVTLVAALMVAWKAWGWARHLPDESIAAARAGFATATVLFVVVLVTWSWPAM